MLFFAQCLGAVLDLLHLRLQHCKARRAFSAAAGQLVCVVNPTRDLKHVSGHRAVPQNAPEQGGCPHRHATRHPRQHRPRLHLHRLHPARAPPCACPLSSCPWEGHLEVVLPHLRQAHRVGVLQGAEMVFLAAGAQPPAPADWVVVHPSLGHHFLLVLRRQERPEGPPQLLATMLLVGTPAQAAGFTYRLELSGDRRRLAWEAAPRSVLERVDAVIADGDCLVLSAALAQLFSHDGGLAIGIAVTAAEARRAEAGL